MNNTIICLIVFALTLLSFAINKFSLGITGLLSLILLVLTGCLDANTALSGFGNTNTILIASMFVVASGLNRTSFTDKIATWIVRVSGGSFKRAWLGFIILGVILTNLMTSPIACFVIMVPMLNKMCEKFDISPSKIMFPMAMLLLTTVAILPMGGNITQSAMFTGFLEAYNVNMVFSPLDMMLGRLPFLIICPLWCYFAGPKFAPEKAILPISNQAFANNNKTVLKPFSDWAGLIIFLLTLIAFLIGDKWGIKPWIAALIGAVLMVVTGVLTNQEAASAVPISLICMVAGTLAMANALTATGAGQVAGDWLARLVAGTHNSYVLGAVFFVIPFVMTQFMLNTAVMNIFAPICILACISIGANPIGLLVIIVAACTASYMTPMANLLVPVAMQVGGYDVKSLIKQGALFSLLLAAVYVVYTMTVLPAF